MITDRIEERSTKPKVVGSSPTGRTLLEADILTVAIIRRVATPVDWLFAPAWLTVEQACELSGWDTAGLLEIIAQGGVDVNDAGLVEKQSLYEFQETLAEVLHW